MIWCRAALATWLAVLITWTQAGCAFFANANAAHSQISPCVDDPSFAAIDLVVGTAGAATIMATDTFEESPAWLALPGLVLLSGVVGLILAHRCNQQGKAETHAAPASSAPASGGYAPDDASSAGDASSAVRNATPEEMGLPPPAPAAPKVRLQLDPDYPAPGVDSASAPDDDDRIECGVTPPIACPPRFWCLIVEANRGYCVPGP